MNPPLPICVGEHLTCSVHSASDDRVTLRLDVTLPAELMDNPATFNEALAPLLSAVERVTAHAWEAPKVAH